MAGSVIDGAKAVNRRELREQRFLMDPKHLHTRLQGGVAEPRLGFVRMWL